MTKRDTVGIDFDERTIGPFAIDKDILINARLGNRQPLGSTSARTAADLLLRPNRDSLSAAR
jgi:hypothetical protein